MNILKTLKSILILSFALYFFCYADEYIVPRKPASVDVADIDLDGDLDIVLGHDVEWEYNYPSFTVMTNIGNGIYEIIDSSKVFCGYQPNMFLTNIDSDNYPDLILFQSDHSTGTAERFIRIYNNNNGIFESFRDHSLKSSEIFSGSNIGDIDSDNDTDILFYSNPYLFWGYIKNDNNNNFSEPVYYALDYAPGGITCGDMNGDERDDVIICGENIDIWFNYETGLEYKIAAEVTNWASCVSVTDIDYDGDNDIIASDWGMAGSPKKIMAYSNDGGGNFEMTYSEFIDEAMAEIFVTDLNNDNYPDVIYNVSIYYPNSEYELYHTYILYNNQDGTFAPPVNYYTGINSHRSHAADLDGNGLKDIITLNYDFFKSSGYATMHILFQDSLGNFVEDSQTSIETAPLINNFTLYQNYPNPFNPVTSIKFALAKTADVKLSVYNISGQLVSQLANGTMNAGIHAVDFDGSKLNSGVYYYTLEVDGRAMTRRMVLMK